MIHIEDFDSSLLKKNKKWYKNNDIYNIHCVKSVCIRSYSGPHFPRIFPHSELIRRDSPYSVRMRENAGKVRTRITPNMDTFYAVIGYITIKK